MPKIRSKFYLFLFFFYYLIFKYNILNNLLKKQIFKGFVFIDSTSILLKEQPDYVLYQEIVQLNQKKCMQNLCAVEPEWIPSFIKSRLDN